MNKQPDIDAKIGEAWKAHYAGKNEAAIEKFLELTQEAPENIDAFWGLGLAYRNAEQLDKAVEAFEKVKVLVNAMLDTETGQLGRYFMLNRMAEQQIQQIGDFLK